MKTGLFAVVLAAAFCIPVAADDEAPNRPVVRSSEYGAIYAKSVPEESYGQKGRTRVFGVGRDRDTLVCEYEWYASEIYIGGSGDGTVIRFGPWHRGNKPLESHLALGIYRDGKTLREYSTLELQSLGSGLTKSVSHYAVFDRRLGFRWLRENSHVYEVAGVSGKVFRFDLDTGAIVGN